MTTNSEETHPDVLAEDRLLWEFWLNHGLEPEPLAKRVGSLPDDANADYMVMNALYGGFEAGLNTTLAAAPGVHRTVRQGVSRVVEAPAARVTLQSPEGRLLALLSLWPSAGSTLASEAGEVARTVRAWPSFVRAVGRANLVAAASTGIRVCGLEKLIPEPWSTIIHRAAEGIRMRSLRVLPLVEEVTSALHEKGIPCCLLKESALIGEIYRTPGERLMGDVDFLVRPGDMQAVGEDLMARGHQPFEGIWSADWYRTHHHHAAPMVDADAASKIEPHLAIWIPGDTKVSVVEEMMESARPHATFKALRPDATFMCFHLLLDLHGGASLGKLGQAADLMRFLEPEGRQVEVSRLLDLAERTGSTPYLEDSVRLVSRIYGRELLTGRAPALASIGRGEAETYARRLRTRVELENVFGFEAGASALSVASIKLLHKSLMRPGGNIAAATAFVKSLLWGSGSSEGAGHIARMGYGSGARRLARLATLPIRAAGRALRARRGRG